MMGCAAQVELYEQDLGHQKPTAASAGLARSHCRCFRPLHGLRSRATPRQYYRCCCCCAGQRKCSCCCGSSSCCHCICLAAVLVEQPLGQHSQLYTYAAEAAEVAGPAAYTTACITLPRQEITSVQQQQCAPCLQVNDTQDRHKRGAAPTTCIK